MRAVLFSYCVLAMGLVGYSAIPAVDSLKLVDQPFKNYAEYLHQQLGDTTLPIQALEEGLKGYYSLKYQGKLKDTTKLTVVDFTQHTNAERLYVIDLPSRSVVWKSLVAHGQGTGGKFAREFSNRRNSHQSSYGFFVTGQRWTDGRLGECLQLYGKEYCNYKALERGIIVHAADYATRDFIKKYGLLGRSYGCPAVPFTGYSEFLDLIDGGTCYFIYYKDRKYEYASKLINSSAYLIEFGQDLGFLM